MGCDCEKPIEIIQEIRHPKTTELVADEFISIKTEKRKECETYINTMKTTDKNSNVFYKNNKIYYPKIVNASSTNDSNQNPIISQQPTEVIKQQKSDKKNIYTKKKIYNTNSNKKKSSKIKKLIKNEEPPDEFSKYILEHINKIREDPKSFIENIENSKSNIVRNKNNKLIYKNKIKVALSQGLPAFEEAISILKNCKSMNKLVYDSGLVVKLPQNEEDIQDKSYFRNEIKKMIDEGKPIQAYWRDIIKDPETSFLLMIVDDTGLKAGMKRKDILDPSKKYIGISSTSIGKHFVCFMTFSNTRSSN